MRYWIGGIVAALCFAVLPVSSALADPIPSGGLARQQVLNWFLSRGYTAEIKHDSVSNDEYVSVASQGLNWGMYFYSCTGATCASVQYSIGWNGASSITDAQVVGWNRDKRFIRAYRTADGNGVFGEYDVDIAPGGSWEQLAFSLQRWEAQLANFKTFVLGP